MEEFGPAAAATSRPARGDTSNETRGARFAGIADGTIPYRSDPCTRNSSGVVHPLTGECSRAVRYRVSAIGYGVPQWWVFALYRLSQPAHPSNARATPAGRHRYEQACRARSESLCRDLYVARWYPVVTRRRGPCLLPTGHIQRCGSNPFLSSQLHCHAIWLDVPPAAGT